MEVNLVTKGTLKVLMKHLIYESEENGMTLWSDKAGEQVIWMGAVTNRADSKVCTSYAERRIKIENKEAFWICCRCEKRSSSWNTCK